MNLTVYNFSNSNDCRKAIDLLNHCIADCMVSEHYIRRFVRENASQRSLSEEQIEARIKKIMNCREKAIGYWISLHNCLQRALCEEELSVGAIKQFDLLWSFFAFNKRKLHIFLERTHEGIAPWMRKEHYGMRHYYHKRELLQELKKLKERLSSE